MSEVTRLAPRDVVRLDHGRVQDLCRQLGVNDADEVVCRAIEDVATKISVIGQPAQPETVVTLRKTARALVPVAEQIGMTSLARVSRDIMRCIDRGDGVALAATQERLLRVGDRSISALWDNQDISI